MAPPFFTSIIDADEWSASCLGRFIPGEKLLYPLDTRLGGTQSQSGRCKAEINLLPLRRTEPHQSSP
jgi:hypothetical protein